MCVHLYHFGAGHIAGTLKEVPALEAALQKPEHAYVPLASTRWKWRETEEYPPLATVLTTPMYKLEQYEPLRARLRQAAPAQTDPKLVTDSY